MTAHDATIGHLRVVNIAKTNVIAKYHGCTVVAKRMYTTYTHKKDCVVDFCLHHRTAIINALSPINAGPMYVM